MPTIRVRILSWSWWLRTIRLYSSTVSPTQKRPNGMEVSVWLFPRRTNAKCTTRKRITNCEHKFCCPAIATSVCAPKKNYFMKHATPYWDLPQSNGSSNDTNIWVQLAQKILFECFVCSTILKLHVEKWVVLIKIKIKIKSMAIHKFFIDFSCSFCGKNQQLLLSSRQWIISLSINELIPKVVGKLFLPLPVLQWMKLTALFMCGSIQIFKKWKTDTKFQFPYRVIFLSCLSILDCSCYKMAAAPCGNCQGTFSFVLQWQLLLLLFQMKNGYCKIFATMFSPFENRQNFVKPFAKQISCWWDDTISFGAFFWKNCMHILLPNWRPNEPFIHTDLEHGIWMLTFWKEKLDILYFLLFNVNLAGFQLTSHVYFQLVCLVFRTQLIMHLLSKKYIGSLCSIN